MKTLDSAVKYLLYVLNNCSVNPDLMAGIGFGGLEGCSLHEIAELLDVAYLVLEAREYAEAAASCVVVSRIVADLDERDIAFWVRLDNTLY